MSAAPTVGRIVLYVAADLVVRPAIVVAVPGGGYVADLFVFDRDARLVESVGHDDGGRQCSWSWPPRVQS